MGKAVSYSHNEHDGKCPWLVVIQYYDKKEITYNCYLRPVAPDQTEPCDIIDSAHCKLLDSLRGK